MDFESSVYFSKVFTTVLFSIFFAFVLVWAYWKGNKSRFEEIKLSIFDDEEKRRMG